MQDQNVTPNTNFTAVPDSNREASSAASVSNVVGGQKSPKEHDKLWKIALLIMAVSILAALYLAYSGKMPLGSVSTTKPEPAMDTMYKDDQMDYETDSTAPSQNEVVSDDANKSSGEVTIEVLSEIDELNGTNVDTDYEASQMDDL